MFDPAIARSVREHRAALAEPPLLPLVIAPEQPAVVLLSAAVDLGLLPVFWPFLWPVVLPPPPAVWLPTGAGAAAGLLLAFVVRSAGWLLILAGLKIAAVAAAGAALKPGARPFLIAACDPLADSGPGGVGDFIDHRGDPARLRLADLDALGIHLVREPMDEVRFLRENERNRVTLVKRLASAASDTGGPATRDTEEP